MIAGMPRSRTLKLAAIGAGAGVFSGLFGVGGGTVMVPLFILWLGYEEREATGTSLAAIVIIAGGRRGGAARLRERPRGRRRCSSASPRSAASSPGPGCSSACPRAPAALLFALLLLASAVKLVVAMSLGGDRHRLLRRASIAGHVRRGRRRRVRARPGDPPRARPGRRRGDVAAGDRPGRARRARIARTRYGNLRLRDGLVVGALAVPFAAVGVVIVNVVPERAIELAFAALLVYVAVGLLREKNHD